MNDEQCKYASPMNEFSENDTLYSSCLICMLYYFFRNFLCWLSNMPVLFVITTLQNLDIFKIDGVISVSKMSFKKKHPVLSFSISSCYLFCSWYICQSNALERVIRCKSAVDDKSSEYLYVITPLLSWESYPDFIVIISGEQSKKKSNENNSKWANFCTKSGSILRFDTYKTTT